jgi:hypothetical protein
MIRRVAPGGVVSTIAGGAQGPGLVDGSGDNARIAGQNGMAWLGGRLYFSDVSGDRIRVITPGADAASTSVATFAGNGSAALRDGPGDAAAFAAPMGISAAPDGTLLVADSGNRAVRRLH